MSRKINKTIHICSDDGMAAMEGVANFIANQMKDNKEIIFQSNFDFMQNDVPFAAHIKRIDDEGNIKVNIIDVDWRLFMDDEPKLVNGNWVTEKFEKWKTVCRDDDGTMSALDAFYYWDEYLFDFDTSLDELKKDILSWMIEDYAFIIDEGVTDHYNCGGFIVYEVPCEENKNEGKETS